MGSHNEPGGVWVVLTAAGSGTRLGADQPKALVEVRGSSLVRLALDRVAGIPGLRGVVITVPDALEQKFLKEAEASVLPAAMCRVTAGGKSRQASVWAGLKLLATWMAEDGVTPEDWSTQTVLVHDAARALAPTSLMGRLTETLDDNPHAGGVIPSLPVADTIKQVKTEGDVDIVTSTPTRANLRAIQTPQAFRMHALHAAHTAHAAKRDDEATAATDDAALLEWEGHQVLVTEGDLLAFKVTTVEDLQVVENQLEVENE